MARQLRAAGQEVAILALLDPSSHIGRNHATLDIWLARRGDPTGRRRVLEVADYLWFKVRKAYDFTYERLRRAVLFPTWGYYRRTGRTLPPFLRRPSTANKLVRIGHAKMPAYEGDAVYFRARSSPTSESHTDTRDTWDRLIKGRLDIVPVPGTHDRIVQEPLAGVLAAELGKALERAAAEDKGQQTHARAGNAAR